MKPLISTDQIILNSDKSHVLYNNRRILCKSNFWLFSCVQQIQLTPLSFSIDQGRCARGRSWKPLLTSLNLSQESWEFNCVPEDWRTDNLCCDIRSARSANRKPYRTIISLIRETVGARSHGLTHAQTLQMRLVRSAVKCCLLSM